MDNDAKHHTIEAETARSRVTTYPARITLLEARRIFLRRFNVPPWVPIILDVGAAAGGLWLGGPVWAVVGLGVSWAVDYGALPWYGRRIHERGEKDAS